MICNPSEETLHSIWRLLPPGTHERIMHALEADRAVQAALAKVVSQPADAASRTSLIAVITRRTGNCVGQALLRKKTLAPARSSESAFKTLPAGTEAAIARAIAQETDIQLGLSPGTERIVIGTISRMAGRCIGEDLISSFGGLEQFLAHLVE